MNSAIYLFIGQEVVLLDILSLWQEKQLTEAHSHQVAQAGLEFVAFLP